ncbi:MAG: 3'-5' exonuclease [Flavobacteriales bacterium]|nr:3'-5' exonuclease [Flavobacteriales bacterium]MBQ19185.1 3'-5' exonuclease [Flavobacteriales bacterium]
MLEKIRLEKILFLDIETVAQQPNFNSVDERLRKFWEQKAKYIAADEIPEEAYSRAGIYAEFGKIVCISVGFITYEGSEKNLRLKSFYGDDEKMLLEEFFDLLNNYFNQADHLLCAHNGKEFDFPYIARRALVNGLNIPSILDLAGKKPWEVAHLDTLQLWKFGDYKNYTSLGLLTAIFNIPTPKDDIDGSMVNQVYWEDKDVERIKIYCEKDVVALTQLFLRYRNEDLVKEENIVFN